MQKRDWIRISLSLDRRLWEEFKRLAFEKHGNFHGALSYEVEEALRNWMVLHTQNHTRSLTMRVNPHPKVHSVFSQVKKYLVERYQYAAVTTGLQIPQTHIVEAIRAIRGVDDRTVRKWMDRFIKYKLIKFVGGQLYEVI